MNALKNLLTNLRDWRARLKGLDFHRLDDLETTRMEAPFLVEEV